jgi:hypothetical protein
MFAAAGIELNSSVVYPKASATALTPPWSVESELSATEPYFDLTESSKLAAFSAHPTETAQQDFSDSVPSDMVNPPYIRLHEYKSVAIHLSKHIY